MIDRTRKPSRAALVCLLGLLEGAGLLAQSDAPRLPFRPGEELVYRMRVSPMGTIGRGTLSVEGPELLRGHEVYVLRFDLDAKVGPFAAAQHSRSWLDPRRMAVLRSHKHEQQPLAPDASEEVEVYPERRRWEAADDEAGRAPTDAPLDELSFLYFIRMLSLADGAEHRFERHFDPERNPVRVRVVGREPMTVPAGTFSTIIVEMRVRDPARYRGEGRIRLHLVDDERRTPVRIETSLPNVGTTTLELETARSGVLARAVESRFPRQHRSFGPMPPAPDASREAVEELAAHTRSAESLRIPEASREGTGTETKRDPIGGIRHHGPWPGQGGRLHRTASRRPDACARRRWVLSPRDERSARGRERRSDDSASVSG